MGSNILQVIPRTEYSMFVCKYLDSAGVERSAQDDRLPAPLGGVARGVHHTQEDHEAHQRYERARPVRVRLVGGWAIEQLDIERQHDRKGRANKCVS